MYGEREPIPNARLIPKDGGRPIEADENGRFSVFLPPGEYALVVRAPGYEDLDAQVTLLPRQDLEMEFRLDVQLDSQRYQTVVEDERAVAISTTTLRDEEIREVAGSQGDPFRVINSLPGVSQLAGFLPYVVVRGAAPGNTGYYLDGSRVPILFHVAIGPSVIHPHFIDAVDFYPGGAPVRLGRFTSGMIEARTRPARRDRVHGEVEVRLTDAGGLLEIPFSRPVLAGCTERKRRKCKRGDPRGALTVAGRYSYTALILSLVQSAARIRYWDYQARLDHRVGRYADYTAFAYGSFDDIGTKEPDPETGERVTFLRFQFHRFDQRIRHRLRRHGLATYAVVLGLDQAGLSGLITNEWRVAPRLDLLLPTRAKAVTLNLGLDQEFQIFRLGEEAVGDLEEVDPADIALLFSERFVSATGGYFDVLIEKGKLQIRPGVRADVYVQSGASPYLPDARSMTHAFGVDPRLLVRETLNERWALRQGLGVFHQPPAFPIPIPGVESFGFERGLQRNIQGSFGYEFQILPDKLRLEQEAYLGRLSNLQDYVLQEESEDEPINELEDFLTNVTGWTYGLETMIKLDPGMRVFGWAAYTLSRSTRDYPLGGSAPSNWDQRHIFNVVLGYRISHKWRLGGRVHYHTGRPWTAPEDGQTTLEALGSNRNNARLPPFFQLDLRLSRTWRFANWQLEGIIDVANATYSREVFQCSASEDNMSEFRAAALAAKVNPSRGIAQCTPLGFRYVIPSLGLRARW
jgi:hypothetical protein